MRRLIVVLFFSLGLIYGQSPQNIPNVSGIQWTVTTPQPTPYVNATSTAQGVASYYYWVVAYQTYNVSSTVYSAPTGPAILYKGPNDFSNTVTATVGWGASTNAAGYYVLRTTSPNLPNGAANILVGSTTGTSLVDNVPTASLTSFSLANSAGTNVCNWTITNGVISTPCAPNSGITVPHTLLLLKGDGVGDIIPAVPGTDYTNAAHLAHVCVEDYLTTLMAGDYGQAINAAVAAQPLNTVTQLNICTQGDHNIGTQAVFDRPISFWMYGSRLIIQNTLSSNPINLTGATLTAGSTTVTVGSTTGLVPGMRVYGIGTGVSNLVQSVVNSTSFTLALPANINITGVLNSTATVNGISSMQGLANQTVTGTCIPNSTNISAVNYASNSLTLSNSATCSPIGVNNGANPTTLSLAAGQTWSSNLKFVNSVPTLLWEYNSSALHNVEGQMIGGDMHGVTLVDPGAVSGGLGRTLSGVEGVQIFGWDKFSSYDYTANGILGTCLVLGGNSDFISSNVVHGPVRESYFYNTGCRDSGDGLTGQGVVELITPREGLSTTADNINQIGFDGLQIVFFYADGLVIASYNTGQATKGPRLLQFGNNTQIENGSHVTNQNIANPYNVVHCVLCDETINFNGLEYAVPGYGKAVFQADSAGLGRTTIEMNSSLIYDGSKTVSYQVNATNGSNTFTYVSGGNGGFDTSGAWDAQGITLVDSGGCVSTCYQLMSMQNSVTNSTTLTSASTYTGTTGVATLTIGWSGYYFNTYGRISKIDHGTGNSYSFPATQTVHFLGLTAASEVLHSGSGFYNTSGIYTDNEISSDFTGKYESGGGTYFFQNPSITASGTGFFFQMPNIAVGQNGTLCVGLDQQTNNCVFMGILNNGGGANQGFVGMVGNSQFNILVNPDSTITLPVGIDTASFLAVNSTRTTSGSGIVLNCPNLISPNNCSFGINFDNANLDSGFFGLVIQGVSNTNNRLYMGLNGGSNFISANSTTVGIGSSSDPTVATTQISATGIVTNAIFPASFQLNGGSTFTIMKKFATASVTPTAVAANTCSDQNFTIAGIASGLNITQINPPATVGNLSLNAFTNSGTVTIHFCNPSIISVTPPAGIYNFVSFS